jgi:hypothetical protein
MSKTYSVAVQNKKGVWITNWNTYYSLEEIDWESVETFCKERNCKAYGYYFGNKSNALTSDKCRTVVKELS